MPQLGIFCGPTRLLVIGVDYFYFISSILGFYWHLYIFKYLFFLVPWRTRNTFLIPLMIPALYDNSSPLIIPAETKLKNWSFPRELLEVIRYLWIFMNFMNLMNFINFMNFNEFHEFCELNFISINSTNILNALSAWILWSPALMVLICFDPFELWTKKWASHSTELRIKKPSGFQHFGLKNVSYALL